MKLVLSPHNDDEALYAAFTIMRERAHVIVCHQPPPGWGDADEREAESRAAVTKVLGGTFEQWNVPPGDDNVLHSRLAVYAADHPEIEHVYAPDTHASHADHVCLAKVAADVFKGKLTTYHTYRGQERVTDFRLVAFEPQMAHLKLLALACYQSQVSDPRTCYVFMHPQLEYYGRDL